MRYVTPESFFVSVEHKLYNAFGIALITAKEKIREYAQCRFSLWATYLGAATVDRVGLEEFFTMN